MNIGNIAGYGLNKASQTAFKGGVNKDAAKALANATQLLCDSLDDIVVTAKKSQETRNAAAKVIAGLGNALKSIMTKKV